MCCFCDNLTTTPPVFSLPMIYKLVGYQSGNTEAQQKLNERIRSFASEQVVVLDLYKMFSTYDDIDQFSDNGVNMNAKGFGIINQYVTSIVLNSK